MSKKLLLILLSSLVLVGCKQEPIEEVKIDSMSNLIATEGSTTIENESQAIENVVENEKGLESLILNSLSDTTALRYKTTVNITTKDGSVSKFQKEESKDTNWLSENPEPTLEEPTIEETVIEEIESVIEETTEENTVTEETTEIETEESETKESEDKDTNWLVTTNKENNNYVISVNYTSEIDNATAKHYGKMNIFTVDKDINEEIAKYHNYIVEPTLEYRVKPTIIVDNEVEKLEDKWYTVETEYTGIRLLREILKNSKVVGSTETVEQYIITTEVVKNYLKTFDITGLLINDLYKNSVTVPVTYYIDKNTELLNRIVLTVPEDITIFGDREIDGCNYTIVFDEFNSINKVMIPDTVTGTAQKIEDYIEPSKEDIERLKNARLDSVDLIKDITVDETIEEETDTIVEETEESTESIETEPEISEE